LEHKNQRFLQALKNAVKIFDFDAAKTEFLHALHFWSPRIQNIRGMQNFPNFAVAKLKVRETLFLYAKNSMNF
jgi:hypothetical protein